MNRSIRHLVSCFIALLLLFKITVLGQRRGGVAATARSSARSSVNRNDSATRNTNINRNTNVNANRNVNVNAGCGTSQGAKYALREPNAQVTAIDISETSLNHTRQLKQKYRLENLTLHQLSILDV